MLRYAGTGLRANDLHFVVEAASPKDIDREELLRLLKGKDDLVQLTLADDGLFRRLMADEEALARVSPRLFFGVLMERAHADLGKTAYTVELMGLQRLPVFDAETVRQFLSEPSLRAYLADLLTSFVKTESFTMYFRRKGLLHRRRFSDLNLADMVLLSTLLEREARPAIYRRIADLALFLPGVFPDYAAARERQLRRISLAGVEPPEGWVEWAQRYYRLAASHSSQSRDLASLHSHLADHAAQAIKALNFVSERYLHLSKHHWFATPD